MSCKVSRRCPLLGFRVHFYAIFTTFIVENSHFSKKKVVVLVVKVSFYGVGGEGCGPPLGWVGCWSRSFKHLQLLVRKY